MADNEMARLDLPAYLSLIDSEHQTISTDLFIYPNSISSTDLHHPPNTSSFVNMGHKNLKRTHHIIKQHHRTIRSSSLDTPHIAHEIKMLAITENTARTVIFPRQMPRSSPILAPPPPAMRLPATPEPLSSTGLYTDDEAMCLVENKRLVHQSIRVARFQSFRPKHVPDTVQYLRSLIASLGQLAIRNPLTAPARIPSRFSSTPAESEPMLQCAHCDVLIPFADLASYKPRSAIALTEELLSQVLAPQHMEQCSGRLGGELLHKDDTQMAVAAASEFKLMSSMSIDSLSGMSLIVILLVGISCSR